MSAPHDYSRPPVATVVAKKNGIGKILLVLFLCFVGVVGFVVACGSLFYFTSKSLPVTLQDRKVIVDAQAVIGFVEGDSYEVRAENEQLSKLRYIDRSYELVYTYEDSSEDGALFLDCTVSVERRVSDAKATYAAYQTGVGIGVSMEDLEIVARNDLIRWGDVSKFSVIKQDGYPVGNMFAARQGRRVICVMMTGIYFDDPDAVSELFMPVLSNLENYDPENGDPENGDPENGDPK